MNDYPSALVTIDDDQGTLRAVAWIQQHTQPGQQHLVWAPGKRNLTYDRNLEAFAKRGAVMTARDHIRSHYGPVLAAWPDVDNLAKIAQMRDITALCVLGWNDKDFAAWVAVATPELLTPGRALPPAPAPVDPVVAAGLTTIGNLVNASNGLVGSYDKAIAIEALLRLKDGGYQLDADGMYAWVMAHGWDSTSAKRLREYATKIGGGVRMRSGYPSKVLREDILQTWRTEATAQDSHQETGYRT
jgi:hypothetical protein